LSGSAQGFYTWNRLNPSARLLTSYNLSSYSYGLGSALRGVPNSDLSGRLFAGLNLDLTISVIPWRGVGEAQWRPFFDIGAAFFKEDRGFDSHQDIKYSAGSDFILYLDFLPGLVAVGSIGIDLTNSNWSDPRKYEISIQSGLHY
jgi:hypothetical protein